ncbi:hemolysin family protein [Deinococcus sp.]|uniref:hemolysin family protein n=1 Tax=Deinococcus sp. TaxID=47478 RepID=UPI0025C3B9EE|nr:hemolysin family protein [Deinococcus sp.]
MTYLTPIVVILLLVTLNGLFVAAEFALIAARRSRLDSMAGQGSASARTLTRLIDQPTGRDGYIATAQLGITLASIGLGMYGEPQVAGWLYGPFERWGLTYAAAHSAGFVIALSFITFMHVVFGEMIPKALALQTPEALSVRVHPLMRVFGVIFRPFVWVLGGLALGLMRLLRVQEPGQDALLYTSRELSIVTDESAQGGQIGDVQRDLIRNIFALEERTAQELMTSRARMDVLSVNASPEEIAARIAQSTRSRYPVYEDTLDHIVGVLHVKDFIRARVSGHTLQLGRLLRPLPSVMAATPAEDLLNLFKRGRAHSALVVDGFGATLGFVTMDDLIADVMDEEDAHAGEWVNINPDGSYTMDGEVTLQELRDDHGLKLRHDDVLTIAGLMLAETGTPPRAGDTMHIQNHDLTAEDVQGLKITRVRVRPLR